MEGNRFCNHCGEELRDGEGTTVNGDLLCNECVEELCVTCEHCSEVIYTDDSITDDHTWLCQDCYESYYRRCESCDRIMLTGIWICLTVIDVMMKLMMMTKSKITAISRCLVSEGMENCIWEWNLKSTVGVRTMITHTSLKA